MKRKNLMLFGVVFSVLAALLVMGYTSPVAAKDKVFNWKFQSHHTPGISRGGIRHQALYRQGGKNVWRQTEDKPCTMRESW